MCMSIPSNFHCFLVESFRRYIISIAVFFQSTQHAQVMESPAVHGSPRSRKILSSSPLAAIARPSLNPSMNPSLKPFLYPSRYASTHSSRIPSSCIRQISLLIKTDICSYLNDSTIRTILNSLPWNSLVRKKEDRRVFRRPCFSQSSRRTPSEPSKAFPKRFLDV